MWSSIWMEIVSHFGDNNVKMPGSVSMRNRVCTDIIRVDIQQTHEPILFVLSDPGDIVSMSILFINECVLHTNIIPIWSNYKAHWKDITVYTSAWLKQFDVMISPNTYIGDNALCFIHKLRCMHLCKIFSQFSAGMLRKYTRLWHLINATRDKYLLEKRVKWRGRERQKKCQAIIWTLNHFNQYRFLSIFACIVRSGQPKSFIYMFDI